MALRTQTSPYVLVGALADLPNPASVPQGYIFYASDTGGSYILDIDTASGVRTWDTFIVAHAGVGQYTVLAGVAIGTVVRISAADTVSAADAGAIATMPAIGVITAKPTSTTATVQWVGEISLFAGLIPGRVYFVDSAGAITATAPVATGTVVQRLGVAKDASTLILQVTPNLFIN